MNGPQEIDDSLPTWDHVRRERDWSGLLLGNGCSQNVWARFGYASLFETAQSNTVDSQLSIQDVDLFNRLKTHNFEVVLSALSIAITVTDALQQDAAFLRERYESIRRALIAAVHYVHLPSNSFSQERRARIAEALGEFEFVYSTNYDLLAYWAVMYSPDSFKDYFWSERFDITDTEIYWKCTKVLYLHGGLHLYRRPTGQTLKRSAEPTHNLLDLFGEPFHDAIPLFISEGNAEEKKASIYRSEYLSFAFSHFSQDTGPLVVFGHSLSEYDKHLTEVLRKSNGRPIAISIKQSGNSIRERKAQLIAALPVADLLFFDAATHPLGIAELRVEDTNT